MEASVRRKQIKKQQTKHQWLDISFLKRENGELKGPCFKSSTQLNIHSTTVCIKESLNKAVIKSHSVPFLFGQKIRANANKHVTYEQQVWLVFNSEEHQYSPACPAELWKGKTFILLHIFTENAQFYQTGQKGKKKPLSNC